MSCLVQNYISSLLPHSSPYKGKCPWGNQAVLALLYGQYLFFSFSKYFHMHYPSQSWLGKSNIHPTVWQMNKLKRIKKSSQGHRALAGAGLQITWLLVTAAPNGAVPKHRTCWITKWSSRTSKPKAITSCCDSNFRLSFYWPVSCLLLTEASTILPFLCTMWGFNKEPGRDHPSVSPSVSGGSLRNRSKGVTTWPTIHKPRSGLT